VLFDAKCPAFVLYSIGLSLREGGWPGYSWLTEGCLVFGTLIINLSSVPLLTYFCGECVSLRFF
jgi:hypothetical protein